jgi:exodeoxyribonuclease V alpha subunit
VERVTFHNEDSGFFVVRVTASGWREPITVVGAAAAIQPGEWMQAEGVWHRDRQHGMQFKADTVRLAQPSSREGMEKYLASGLIKGIGPAYAKRLIAKFGEDVFDVIEHYSKRLQEVSGIGPERRKRIKEAWDQQKGVREIMVFLHTYGIGTSRAVRIFKTYGDEAIGIIRANPYRLASDIIGIGFKTADQLAGRLGIEPGSRLRIQAGLRHILQEQTDRGHCALPKDPLLEGAAELLGVDRSAADEALGAMVVEEEVFQELVRDALWIFLPRLRAAEIFIAETIRYLAKAGPTLPTLDFSTALELAVAKTGTVLAEGQQSAIRLVLTQRLSLITGGPGVGKTTVLNTLLRMLESKRLKITLCAPTGRAAKRLAETTGHPAMTIHRLLGGRFGGKSAEGETEWRADLVVVDESSMIDVPLMARLLRALPPGAHLVLVGDADQLPSVGPGTVFKDLLQSGIVPVAHLTEIFRQAAASRIVTSAHAIREGREPEEIPKGEDSDFYFVERPDAEAIHQTLLKMVGERIPQKFGMDACQDVQVLTPMNRGSLGTIELNRALQELLNPPRTERAEVERFGLRLRVGDKVIQTRNNYDKEVFNGDIGRVETINEELQELTLLFDGRPVTFEFAELDELQLAYAISIHKSQGSEYPAVVIPLAAQHFMLLQRNLIYTAVTRGRKLVVVIGERRSLRMSLKNDQAQERFTALLDRLNGTLTNAG